MTFITCMKHLIVGEDIKSNDNKCPDNHDWSTPAIAVMAYDLN